MTMTGIQMNEQLERELAELVDAVVSAAQEVHSAFEWGCGISLAEKQLKDAKDDLRTWVIDLIGED